MCGISFSMYSRFEPITLALDTSRSNTATSIPLPMSISMSVTIGDSRRSSVPALNDMPRMPMRLAPVPMMVLYARSMSFLLLSSAAAIIGVSTSSWRAL